ncbi:CDP-glycerol glycerophosphotransferase family protein [Pseudocolwellia agarivorans]|uniref:CDP-glycerol glycerophosphotransferase family protein n=1 Tax=Pseudocolwellia agarivorans TaxID=1911682 RepID=UPI003F88242A
MSRYLFYISQNYSFAILRPLQKAILARGGEAAWFVEGDNVNHEFFNKDEVLLPSIDAVKEYNPRAVFVPGNVVPSFVPGLKVGVFHGFNSGKRNRKGKEDHFNIRGSFDLYCTQGPNTTETFNILAEKAGYFDVKETGWPAIDPLYEPLLVKKEIERPTILFCSTFSRNLTSAPHLFEEIKRLSITGKYRWLVQFHPKMPKEIIEQYKAIESEHLSFVETDNVIPLLQEADLMVCDTSSVLLMFLLLNKPVVTFNNISPKEYLINISEPELLESSIELGLTKPKELMTNIESFIEQTHPYQDGGSSERVLDAVDEILSRPQKSVKKPLNLLRQFKMRKKLGYWKL